MYPTRSSTWEQSNPRFPTIASSIIPLIIAHGEKPRSSLGQTSRSG